MTDHGPAIITRTEAGGRCLHDLLPGQCAPCAGLSLDGETRTPACILERDTGFDIIVDVTFTARFDGACSLDEGHTIEAGDRIGSTDVGYVCRLCVARLA